MEGVRVTGITKGMGLVKTPDADDLLVSAQLETGVELLVGKVDVDSYVGPEIQGARIALKEGVRKIIALTEDVTRTEPERHAAGKKVADELVDKLNATRVAIESRANQLLEDGEREAEAKFARGTNHDAIREWVAQQLKKGPEGFERVKKLIQEDVDVAAVIYSSKWFLLGFSEEMHDTMKYSALEIHYPKIYAKFITSVELTKYAGRIKTTIERVQHSFYNPMLADQTNRRVAV